MNQSLVMGRVRSGAKAGELPLFPHNITIPHEGGQRGG